MDADFSIELGQDDPVLDFPWSDPNCKFAYFDLKRHPEMLEHVREAMQFPELGKFLQVVNSAASSFESAKCDAWASDEFSPDEEIFGASQKFVSYVDLIFSDGRQRLAFQSHEWLAKRLTELLRRAPEIPSSAEALVRRAYYAGEIEVREGRNAAFTQPAHAPAREGVQVRVG